MEIKRKIIIKKFIRSVIVIFLLMNVIAAFHAWKFTHFSTSDVKALKPEALSMAAKLKAIAFGVDLPRPENTALPSQPFETVKIEGEKMLEGWHVKRPESQGTVVIFHGFKGEKSGMLDKSDEFLKMGYNTLLVDFRGSGGSEGNQTTIGFDEAEDVKASFDFLKKSGEENILLFGTSMGAVAVMKAIQDFSLEPRALILECPFGTMYETTCARFRAMGVPPFPMAGLLMFWGGLENGFWAFSHKPEEYARAVDCPTLLLWGEQDATVSSTETDIIFENLQGPKTLKTYPMAGHENYLLKYQEKWVENVFNFIQNLENQPVVQ